MFLKSSTKVRFTGGIALFASFALLSFPLYPAPAVEPLFDARIVYGAGYGPSSVFYADLDGDGDLD